MTWRRAGPRHTDSGAATVLVVAMAGVLMFVAVGLAAAGGLVTAQRRAQSAADLTALAAAASVELDACAEALRTAAANAATLDECELDGSDVLVTVSVAGPSLPGRRVRVSAEARAGPGRQTEGSRRADLRDGWCRSPGCRRGARPRRARASR